ncbi:MAG: GMC family oxidoreductase [Gammaproteobacteria bacterium]|nr:GMC family oxidoreductase [Gammaproteobacteria bacterium]
MIIDFRMIDAKAIDADLCIIGGGAAGITLGRAFAGTDIRVCLLESGGFEHDADIQALYDGKDTGYYDVYDLQSSRHRRFGGSTHAWVGHCAVPTAMDFERRPWIRNSGWPIGKTELDRYYVAAHEVLEIGAYRYDLAEFPARAQRTPLFNRDKIIPRVWRLSPPTRFGRRYRHDLERATNVRVFLHANVVELETDGTATRVIAAQLRTLDGRHGRVRAKYFVLACGGIENARLLLLSDRAAHQGLGNRYDIVGRYYMDQLRIPNAAVVEIRNPRRLRMLVGDFHEDGVRFETMVCPADSVQRQHETLNWGIEILPIAETAAWAVALRGLRQAQRERTWPDNLTKQVRTLIANSNSAVMALMRHLARRSFSLLARCEVAPDWNNRVTLSDERDALGQRKIERYWRLSTHEKHTTRTAVRVLGDELARLGLGSVQPAGWLGTDDDIWPKDIIAGPHHIGTTRMASDPKHGVVDATCRVHDMENLYIVGSSTFPACGYAHPTLTIVALTLRLADHLKKSFASKHTSMDAPTRTTPANIDLN